MKNPRKERNRGQGSGGPGVVGPRASSLLISTYCLYSADRLRWSDRRCTHPLRIHTRIHIYIAHAHIRARALQLSPTHSTPRARYSTLFRVRVSNFTASRGLESSLIPRAVGEWRRARTRRSPSSAGLALLCLVNRNSWAAAVERRGDGGGRVRTIDYRPYRACAMPALAVTWSAAGHVVARSRGAPRVMWSAAAARTVVSLNSRERGTVSDSFFPNEL